VKLSISVKELGKGQTGKSRDRGTPGEQARVRSTEREDSGAGQTI